MHKCLQQFKQLEEEEPELHVLWNEELGEIQVQLMGDVQIEILKHMLEERYGLLAGFDTGNIVYKETILNTAFAYEQKINFRKNYKPTFKGGEQF